MKISKGKAVTEISYADSHGDTKEAAEVSFRPLISVDEELTMRADQN